MDYSKTSIIDLAALLAKHLQHHGVEVVLVGGLAVEIYTENLYLTKDIDMVNTNYKKPSYLNKVMGELGFRKHGRVYINESTEITVEFPPGPLAVGNNFIKNTTVVNTGKGSIPILYVRDVVIDRLAAYIHWQDRQSLIQATAVMLKHNLEPKDFKKFLGAEGDSSDYELLGLLFAQAQTKNITAMAHLESLLSEIIIGRL
ncbi:MAG TPA: nucleotidyltransferase [Cellvibrio sp.]|nr:nucleotidyltransferase [Cellvibrio sp.]